MKKLIFIGIIVFLLVSTVFAASIPISEKEEIITTGLSTFYVNDGSYVYKIITTKLNAESFHLDVNGTSVILNFQEPVDIDSDSDGDYDFTITYRFYRMNKHYGEMIFTTNTPKSASIIFPEENDNYNNKSINDENEDLNSENIPDYIFDNIKEEQVSLEPDSNKSINFIYVLMGVLVLLFIIFFSLSNSHEMRQRYFLFLVIALNTIYLTWVFFYLVSTISYLFYFSEILLFFMTLVYGICHWRKEHVHHADHPPSGKVDVFVTCYNEPPTMIEKTIKAACAMDYKDKIVYVLDDGNKVFVKEIAQKYGAKYLARKENKDAKAGNLNFGMKKTKSPYIMTLDADQVPEKHFLKDVMGHFNKGEHIAVVTTRQRFDVHKKDFNHDHMFYNHMQPGKNSHGCATSTGSGVIYKRKALEEIGGFDTWNIVEDLTTTYKLNQKGYKSIYVGKAYTTGLAPQDLKNIYKQRGTWALDSLRIFFRKNPFFVKGLNFHQRVHYFEMTFGYVVSALAVPILMLMPIYSLFANRPVISIGPEYFIIRGISLISIVMFYHYASNKGYESNQMWVGMWPIFMKAAFIAIFLPKGKYKVTNKVENQSRRIFLVIPQLAIVISGIAGLVYSFFSFGMNVIIFTNGIWVLMAIWWMTPIIKKGFTKKHRHTVTLHKILGKNFT